MNTSSLLLLFLGPYHADTWPYPADPGPRYNINSIISFN